MRVEVSGISATSVYIPTTSMPAVRVSTLGSQGQKAKLLPTPKPRGPASLSKDGVQLLGNVALLGVLPLLTSAHHYVGVCFAIGICGSQVGSLGG